VLNVSVEGVTRAFLTNKMMLGGAVWLRRCQRNDCSANHLLEHRRPGYDRSGPVSICDVLLTSGFDFVNKTRLLGKICFPENGVVRTT
jgi:hypothetical protein